MGRKKVLGLSLLHHWSWRVKRSCQFGGIRCVCPHNTCTRIYMQLFEKYVFSHLFLTTRTRQQHVSCCACVRFLRDCENSVFSFLTILNFTSLRFCEYDSIQIIEKFRTFFVNENTGRKLLSRTLLSFAELCQRRWLIHFRIVLMASVFSKTLCCDGRTNKKHTHVQTLENNKTTCSTYLKPCFFMVHFRNEFAVLESQLYMYCSCFYQ